MGPNQVEAALEPLRTAYRPFAARKRVVVRTGEAPMVTHFDLLYRQWDGPQLTFAEDFGKKRGQVYSRDGDEPIRSCNEVEVAKRLRRVRSTSFWISCYAPNKIPDLWRPWTLAPAEMPDWLTQLDREVRAATGHATGGIPDVVAWGDGAPRESAIFVECKGAKEGFNEGQEDWVAAALRHGMRPEQFAVAVRHFADND